MPRAGSRGPAQWQSWSLSLRQVQRGPLAEPPRGRPRSARRAIAARCITSAIDASRRSSMAEIPVLVHGVGTERDGLHRSQNGVEVCGAGAGTGRDRSSPVIALCTTSTRVGRSNAEPSLAGFQHRWFKSDRADRRSTSCSQQPVANSVPDPQQTGIRTASCGLMDQPGSKVVHCRLSSPFAGCRPKVTVAEIVQCGEPACKISTQFEWSQALPSSWLAKSPSVGFASLRPDDV
jgi:hypothetical protein